MNQHSDLTTDADTAVPVPDEPDWPLLIAYLIGAPGGLSRVDVFTECGTSREWVRRWLAGNPRAKTLVGRMQWSHGEALIRLAHASLAPTYLRACRVPLPGGRR